MKESAGVLRARILNGAIALFTECGIERVTTRELTERLGISRSHIYHYFRDWETLCREAMSHFLREDEDAFTASLQGLPAPAQLSAYVANYLPAVPDASWTLYSSLWQLAIHDPDWAELAQSVTERWEQMMAEIIRRGIAGGNFACPQPDQLTRQLSAMLNGYADRLIIAPCPEGHQAAIADIHAFIALALPPAA